MLLSEVLQVLRQQVTLEYLGRGTNSQWLVAAAAGAAAELVVLVVVVSCCSPTAPLPVQGLHATIQLMPAVEVRWSGARLLPRRSWCWDCLSA